MSEIEERNAVIKTARITIEQLTHSADCARENGFSDAAELLTRAAAEISRLRSAPPIIEDMVEAVINGYHYRLDQLHMGERPAMRAALAAALTAASDDA